MLKGRTQNVNELKDVLWALSQCSSLEYEQLLKLLSKKADKAQAIINKLIKSGRIYYDMESEIVGLDKKSAKNPDYHMIKAFWVLLDFKGDIEHYYAAEYPILLNFFAKGESYEIVYAKEKDESVFNYLMENDADAGAKTLVIIDDESQLENLDNIHNLLCYCMVSEDGQVDLFETD